MSEPIIISFSCANSDFAAKLMNYFDKLNSEITSAVSAPSAPPAPPVQPQYDTFHPTAPQAPPSAPYNAPAQPSPQPAPTAQPPQQYPPMQGVTQQPQSMPPQMQNSMPPANFNTAAGTAPAAPQYQQQSIPYTPVQTVPSVTVPPAGKPAVDGTALLNAVQLFSSASDANREKVRLTLLKFNAESFSHLSPSAYSDFAAALREQGARI